MPYRNMGDYYQGDYYQGDPFLGFIGKAIMSGGRAAGGLLKGALGMGKRKASTAIVRQTAPAITMSGRAGAIARQAGEAIQTTVRAHPAAVLGAGAASAAGVAALATRAAMGPSAAGMRGFHLSRRTGRAVRNRRMRVTNVKALHRSLRRIGGFARIARRVLHFTHPKMARGRPTFRFKRKARRV